MSAEGHPPLPACPSSWEARPVLAAALTLGTFEGETSIGPCGAVHLVACPRSLRQVHLWAPTPPVTLAWSTSTPCAGQDSLSTDASAPCYTCFGVCRTCHTCQHST